MEERQHHLRESSSAGLRRSQKLEILPSPNSKSLDAYICGRQHLLQAAEISTVALLLSYIMRRKHSSCGADILCMRRYFGQAHIFHERKHFMGANISWAQIFHGREYFMSANILCVNYYFRQAPIFNDFLQSVLPVLFCNKFCLILLPIFVYIFSIYLCMLCAPIFLAQMF